MCGIGFWKKVAAFCLTFGLGLFISDMFSLNETAPSKVVKQNIPPPVVLFEPQEVSRKTPKKPLCKKYPFDIEKGIDELVKLNEEKLEKEDSMERNKNISQKKKEILIRRLQEIEEKFSIRGKGFSKGNLYKTNPSLFTIFFL